MKECLASCRAFSGESMETWPEVLEHANGNRVFMMCAAGVRHDIQYMCMCNLLSNERLLRNRFGAQTQGCY